MLPQEHTHTLQVFSTDLPQTSYSCMTVADKLRSRIVAAHRVLFIVGPLLTVAPQCTLRLIQFKFSSEG